MDIRIGQDVIVAGFRGGYEGIGGGDGGVGVYIADVVDSAVHEGEAAGAGYDLVAMEGLVLEELLFVLIEVAVFGETS